MRTCASIIALAILALVLGCEGPSPEPDPVREVIAFTAKWCGPCQRDKPTLRSLRATVNEIDIDQNPDLAQRYEIDAVPTYIYGARRTHDITEVQRWLAEDVPNRRE